MLCDLRWRKTSKEIVHQRVNWFFSRNKIAPSKKPKNQNQQQQQKKTPKKTPNNPKQNPNQRKKEAHKFFLPYRSVVKETY